MSLELVLKIFDNIHEVRDMIFKTFFWIAMSLVVMVWIFDSFKLWNQRVRTQENVVPNEEQFEAVEEDLEDIRSKLLDVFDFLFNNRIDYIIIGDLIPIVSQCVSWLNNNQQSNEQLQTNNVLFPYDDNQLDYIWNELIDNRCSKSYMTSVVQELKEYILLEMCFATNAVLVPDERARLYPTFRNVIQTLTLANILGPTIDLHRIYNN